MQWPINKDFNYKEKYSGHNSEECVLIMQMILFFPHMVWILVILKHAEKYPIDNIFHIKNENEQGRSKKTT